MASFLFALYGRNCLLQVKKKIRFMAPQLSPLCTYFVNMTQFLSFQIIIWRNWAGRNTSKSLLILLDQFRPHKRFQHFRLRIKND